jgi:hypothetical protein
VTFIDTIGDYVRAAFLAALAGRVGFVSGFNLGMQTVSSGACRKLLSHCLLYLVEIQY